MTKLPCVVGVEAGTPVFATIIEHGVPVWKRGKVLAVLPHFRFQVQVDGETGTRILRQEDLRSVTHILRSVH